MGRRLLAPLPVVALCLVAIACTTDQFIAQSGVPGTSTPAKVVSVTQRWNYLDTTIETGGYTLRFFLPDSEDCRAVVDVDAGSPRYQSLGPLGRLTRGDLRCDPLGILSLATWRDRRPRPPMPRTTVPRAAARFSVIHRDDDLIMLQGRFPLASYIGWAGGYATRAVVPVDPDCEAAVASGTTSMEYRPAGKRPFTLNAPNGLCDILGFVYEKPPPAQEGTPEEPATPTEPAAPADPAQSAG